MNSEILAKLAIRMRQIERTRAWSVRDVSALSPAGGLQQLLPDAVSLRGGLVEWLSDLKGAGSLSLAVLASQPAIGEEPWIFIESQSQWHAAGLAGLSLDLQRLVFVQSRRPTDAFWAAEQALRTRGVGAVVCEFDRLSTAAFRRLQLAAETGGTLGILLRPERVRHQPSWAECRLLVRPLAVAGASALQPRRRLRVELLRARREPAAAVKSVIVELDDADNRVCLVSELATAATSV
jgi:protein ImuA